MSARRQKDLLKSQQHTKIVRLFRRTLPVFALFLLCAYAASLFYSRTFSSLGPQLPLPRITSQDLAMHNPHYEGTTQDGGTYQVRADLARQDFSDMNLVQLEGISGELTHVHKPKIFLNAIRGTFDQKASILILKERIDITTEDGMHAKLTTATVKTKEGSITSEEPVFATFPAGSVQSKELAVEQKKHTVTFLNEVVTQLKPKPQDPHPQNKNSAPSLFGQTDSPIDITSQRLDIRDELKSATFSGNVKAKQDAAALEAPELIVHYDNDPPMLAQGNDKSQTQETGAKIKIIDVKGPFLMTRGEKERVTGETASFNNETRITHLQSKIHMSSVPDHQVFADWVELDQNEDTVLLMGNVNVINGETFLKGRHLYIERKRNTSTLTSPASPGNQQGRITAHFVGKTTGTQKSLSSNSLNLTSSQGTTTSSSGLKEFKTNPDAPIDIEATRLDIDDEQKTAIFKGDVHVRQEGVLMISPAVKAYYTGSARLADPEKPQSSSSSPKTANQLRRIEALEKVVVRTEDGREVRGDWATYEAKTNLMVVGGDVELNQGNSVIRGSRLSIDMITGKSTIDTANAEPDVKASNPSWDPNMHVANSASASRPSAIFFPNEFKETKENSKVSKPKSPNTSGWTSQTKAQ